MISVLIKKKVKLNPGTTVQFYSILGLHTCGNLASSSLRIFLSQGRGCRFVANVGCCYHHLNERFYRNPWLSDQENDECNANSGILIP